MFYNEPFISVVTPFRDTAPYLAQCIESVLSQGYRNFEYILSDNCSTDGSTEIAEGYARRDARIRLVRQPEMLGHAEHYNRALSEMSNTSQYCKIVQADDFIFPDCLQSLVKAFATSDTIGIVSSYELKANGVCGPGLPYPAPMLAGTDVARLYLRKKTFIFGTPTTVMYRSDLVRSKSPFFSEQVLHPDTEKCLEILEHWDFAFVHQVLSFTRTDNINESVSDRVRDFKPDQLDTYINVQRYAGRFLDKPEADLLKRQEKRQYYRALGKEALRLRGSRFWKYHVEGLNTLGESLDRSYLAMQIAGLLFELALNPGITLQRALRAASCWIGNGRTRAGHLATTGARVDNTAVTSRLSNAVNADR